MLLLDVGGRVVRLARLSCTEKVPSDRAVVGYVVEGRASSAEVTVSKASSVRKRAGRCDGCGICRRGRIAPHSTREKSEQAPTACKSRKEAICGWGPWGSRACRSSIMFDGRRGGPCAKR